MRPPRTSVKHLTVALAGGILAASALLSTGVASAAEAPQIVLMKPDSNLAAQVRDERSRGNEVDTVIRTIGKGFVADLDAADVNRLRRDPDVLLVERDRPLQAIGGVTAAEAGVRPQETGPKALAVANDAFADARVISGASGTVTGTTVGAGREAGEPSHGGGGGSASIWYRWTAPSSGTVRMTTQGASYDTLLGAYTGSSVSSLTTLDANDDNPGGGRWSSISFTATAGSTYLIAIDGYGGWTGATVLNWSLSGSTPAPPAVPNDLFTDAQKISGTSGTVAGTSVGAKREAGEPDHGSTSGRASIWYEWTAPSSGTLMLSTQGSSFDTLLGAYTGPAVSSLSQMAVNDDASGVTWSQMSIPVAAGTTYRIAVDGWGGYTGTTSLSWSLGAAATPTPDPTPSPAPAPTPDPGTTTRTAASWGLDRIDQAALPLDGRITTSRTGVGVTAYIIDTGVRSDHTEFTGRIAPGYTAVADGNGTNDCNGHGSHVAGTVAGTTYGVAPGATVVPVRVLDCSGSGTTSGVIAGIDWTARNHAAGTPAVANMSLGGGYSAALNAAVAAAVADGISFSVAAGNSSDDACSYSPASEPTAITVGATTSTDARSSFSNWGSCLDVFAPGSAIRSAYYSSPTATATMSGTSMASPHAAGAAALLLSAQPTATPAAVRDAMTSGATRNALTDMVGSPNVLVNVASGVVPAAPAAAPQDVTPATAPPPETDEAPATSAPRRIMSAPPAPRLVAAKRSSAGLRLSIRGKGVGYQVLLNGKVIARTTSLTPTVRTRLARVGSKVRVRAYNSAGVSAPSNAIRVA